MQRILAIILIMRMLCGCVPAPEVPAYITVSLSLGEGCRVTENGLRISSGEDAVFEMTLEEGYTFASLDYDGEYTVETENGVLYLRLKEVRYPTLAAVKLTSRYCSITYEPNGAEGQGVSVSYDTDEHLRPNTSIGTDIFERDGYTLTGWNSAPDGSGEAVGLGSRVSVPDGTLTLYAQWQKWLPEDQFAWEETESGIRITAYRGNEDTVVVPGILDGKPVTAIGSAAFLSSTATHVILPLQMRSLEEGAFTSCALKELTIFDTIETFGDVSFKDCPDFSTLHINAVEAPWGFDYRRESCLADKLDILIEAQGKKKIVFYGGCSMWYNLDGELAQEALGEEYQVINMGINGVMNSSAQMQILSHYLEPGDIFFHTPEVSSAPQMMERTEMINHDRKLWCGMEYNYDMVSLLDIRTLPNFFNILYYWLSTKACTSSYTDVYRDYLGNDYVDEYGCASFYRNWTAEKLEDSIKLDPACFEEQSMHRLQEHYRFIQEQGARIYVGHACINLDALPQEHKDRVEMMDGLFRETFTAMEGITVVGSMENHLFHNRDFYDTNYHLLTASAHTNTAAWMDALIPQLIQDGLLPNN